MKDLSSTTTGVIKPDTGNPMNLTCTTSTTATQTAGTVITIVLCGPGATPPPPPANSTVLVAPNSNVEFVLTGTGPDGTHLPQGGMKIGGAGVAVYSSP